MKEPRIRQLNLSFTTSELETIVGRAQAVGMRPCHFGRAAILDVEKAAAPAARAEDNLQRLVLQQLSRIGNNLNQMVRHLHATGDPLPPDLEPLLKDIRALMTKVAE
jgi:hypothetical protein